MLRLSKRADYGLLALGFMGRAGDSGWMRSETIATHYRIPEEQLGKVMQELSRAGILEARVGRRGGYRLARSLHDVSLSDLVGAIEHRLETAECLRQPPRKCEQHEHCELRDPLLAVERRLRDVLEDVSIAELTGVDRQSHSGSDSVT